MRIVQFAARTIAAVVLSLFAAPVAFSQYPSHLPLAPGSRWTLAGPHGQTMTFEVAARDGDTYRVRWQNPWNTAEFHFVTSGNRVILKGLDMGQGLMQMPPDTVYFDFGQRQGGSWSNVLGRMDILSRGKQLSTAAGSFEDTIEVRATDKKGFSTYFTFAPNVGFVQFGRGDAAFRLQEYSDGQQRSARVEQRPTPRAGRRTPENESRRGQAASGRGAGFLVGLDSNPPPSEGYSNESNDRRFNMSVDAGMTMTFLHPKWDELEPRPGNYTFGPVEFRHSLAEKYDVPILLNVRIIDGPNRAMPSPYKNWKFDDPKLAGKLRDLLRRFSPEFRRRVRWVGIGNEVDHYFNSHKGEVEAYARLISSILPTVRELFPGAPFTVTFSDQRLDDFNHLYRPILDQVDFYAYNYYPINADFTFRDPESARNDLNRMITAAGNKPVFFQELGYSSSSRLGSSEDEQARFVEVVFATLSQHRGQIIGANFNWMSDLPDSVVDQLGGYYKVNSENFKQFLGTLGWFRTDGSPKKAWHTFQRLAR